ncbi:MAG: DUF4230 domain-containing protein [Chloroflexota bacterium]|nr:DUF4230 domain-containing protein [Chloroflexota bacterium]
MNEREPDYLDEQRWKPKRRDDSEPTDYPQPPSDLILPPEPVYTYRASDSRDNLPTPARGGCRGCVWVIAGVGGCMGIIVVALVGAVALGFVSIGGLFGGFGGVFNPPVRADVVSSRTLVTRLQPLGVLVTFQSEMALENVRVGVQQNVGNACGIAASHRATGGVEAGIDLSMLTENDVVYDVERDTYVVTLPAPVLTTCRIDTIQQYDRTFTMCPVDWDNVRALAQYNALTKLRDDAVEGGMLERAGSEAQIVLANVFTELGVNVEIQFRDPSASVAVAPTPNPSETTAPDAATPASGIIGLGASCQPVPPVGWYIDPATGGWTR